MILNSFRLTKVKSHTDVYRRVYSFRDVSVPGHTSLLMRELYATVAFAYVFSGF